MLILDEPTNHLDLFAKEVLEAALMDYEGTLLFISHDRYFLNKMAERIVELHPGGTEHYLGNYDDYVEKKQELEDIAREAAEARLASSKNQLNPNQPYMQSRNPVPPHSKRTSRPSAKNETASASRKLWNNRLRSWKRRLRSLRHRWLCLKSIRII